MKISYNGQGVYQNKTIKFLIQILNATPEVARIVNSGFYKLAAGIDDFLYKKKKGRFIFILVYKKYQEKLFETSLEKLKLQDSYIDDYTVNNNEHMLVLEVSKKFSEAYDNFLKGKYSKMYDREFVDTVFSKPHQIEAKNILLRNEEAKWEYYKHLKTYWGVQKPFELAVQEYEEPLKYKEEIFNYSSDKPVYIKVYE